MLLLTWCLSSLAVTTSLEEALSILTTAGDVDDAVFKALWAMVKLPGDAGVAVARSRGAMAVLAMVARAEPAVVDCPLGIARIGDVLERSHDYRLARHACAALRVLARHTGDVSLARHASIDTLLSHAAAMVQGCVLCW